MFRIAALERLGVHAAMTEAVDGDCAQGTPGRMHALKAFGAEPNALACVRQVHGNTVFRVDRGNIFGAVALPEGDALISDQRGVVLGVTVADCVPVFLAAPGMAIGLAHSGREGTRQNIAGATVCAMAASFGVRAASLHAFIGPGAGACCYAVDEATAGIWREAGGRLSGLHLDLPATIYDQLCAAGLDAGKIAASGDCTICCGRYFSYRRDRTSARNLALLAF